MINLYPEQLRQIADMCEALDKIDGVGSGPLRFKQGIQITDEYGEVFGYLGDEIGGVWGFWPGTKNPYDKVLD